MKNLVIKNAKLNGEVTDITVVDGKIAEIGKTDKSGYDAKGNRIFAGLIDVHTHAAMGKQANNADVDEMADILAKRGTTAFLPTTSTIPYEELEKATNIDIDAVKGAHVLGFHAEGPYLSYNKRGAQNPDYLRNPVLEEFEKFPNMRMVTVAPELPGAMEFIKNCKAITVIGHTECDYDMAMEAIENGVTCLTHTFNAMPPILHRAPSVIGAAVEKKIYAQLICDGIHVHRGAVWLIYRAFGPEKTVFISDSIEAAGLPDGEYGLGGMKTIVKDGKCMLADGSGTISGSTSFLLDCVKKAIEFGIPEQDAFRMASQTPAELLGINKGKIEVGYDADFIVLDEDYNLLTTIIEGEVYYEK